MRLLSFSALFFSASVLAGGTLTIDGSGYATGITDFYWGDSDYYDVSFEAGSYDEVYGANTPLFMNNSSEASEAADEVMALLNGTSPVTNVSSDPNNGILIPISLNTGTCQVRSQNREMNAGTGLHQAYGDFCYAPSDVTSPRGYHLVFTLDRIRDSGPQIPVPVMPWPALLLLAGFIGLFGVRKSRG
jgi:hypothetical protein